MSCVCILTPVVIAAWPAFSAAVVAAATSLGYAVMDEAAAQLQVQAKPLGERAINLEINQSEIVTNHLGRDQRIRVERGGVTVTFSRDARGTAAICVSGSGHTDEQLRAIGEELSQRVVQKYVHTRVLDEIRARQFVVVEEETDEHQSIRIKVRHWDN